MFIDFERGKKRERKTSVEQITKQTEWMLSRTYTSEKERWKWMGEGIFRLWMAYKAEENTNIYKF